MTNPLSEPKTNLPGAGTAQAYPERRQANRLPFTASIVVTDVGSATRVAGRSSDLSMGGCYVDTTAPFAMDAIVHVKIERDPYHFEASAKVVYSHSSMGMGLKFTKMDSESEKVLRAWVDATDGGSLPDLKQIQTQLPSGTQTSAHNLRQAFTDLVKLMVEKQILTDHESWAVLRKLL